MSDLARKNGWRGFDGLAEKVKGGWLYRCDGMPSMFGCGEQVIARLQYVAVGTKHNGWLVTYGKEGRPGFGNNARLDSPEQWQDDHDVVLTFCPSCAVVVKEQDELRKQVRG